MLSFELKDSTLLPKKLQALVNNHQQQLNDLLQENPTPSYQVLVSLIEKQSNDLHHFWSPISHLNAVKNNEELREVYQQCLPILSAHSTYLSHHKPLYHALQHIADASEFNHLTIAQQQYIKNELRDFKLNGVNLPEEKKKRFGEIVETLSKLANQFENHLLDATQAWHLSIEDADTLKGLPQQQLDLLKQLAQNQGKDGYLVTLHAPSYQAIMTYADNRSLRQKVYEAFVTRASDQGPHDKSFDNSEVIFEILTLRQELSCILGFTNYAEYSLATKMANTPDEVESFLVNLAKLAKPFAEKDFNELQKFAATLGIESIEPWDVGYVSEKLKQKLWDIDDEKLRPYFPLPQVLQGLFSVTEKLYGITFKREQSETWHKDVEFYALVNEAKQTIAYCYIDLYAREKKRDGAWMDDAQSRWHDLNNKLQLPIAYVTCNFMPPVSNQPALLNHDEVVTLFHELGHALHHMLTNIDVLGVTGINGVAWDAVELPSQFFENFAWQKICLPIISSHFETQEALPENLLKNLLESKNFQAGMFLVRQLEFALFDLRLHRNFDPTKGYEQVQQILNQARKEVAVIPIKAYNRFQHGFGHVFAGGYAAGYYSYLWAEVLAADAFAYFEEQGVLSREAGEHFKNTLLSQGGSQKAAQLFKNFRSREPALEPLLKSYGLV